MSDKVNENNQVTIMGEIVSSFVFNHEVAGEGFYTMHMKIRRTSENSDTVPVMVSERLIDVNKDYKGCFLKVSGQFRSCNQKENEKQKLILFVFAREVSFLEEEPKGFESNNIFLDGYVCKKPIYRKTPLGREITDLLLAVNRSYGKSDYIPCICWGRNARYAFSFETGEHIQLSGRIQSREYTKRISEEECEERTAYEVSASLVERSN